MNDVVRIENDVYERYEELLIRKDVLKKESFHSLPMKKAKQ